MERLLFSDVNVGQTLITHAVVKSATVRKTTTNKDYIAMVLFDGVSDISATQWNWDINNEAPKANDVLKIDATVGEYKGAKQLSIQRFKPSTDFLIEDFVAKGPIDVEEYWNTAMQLISDINNGVLRSLTKEIFTTFEEDIRKVPCAKSIHQAYIGGTLQHLVDVAKKARAMAMCTVGANIDLVTAGALLHDIGKIYTYSVNGVNIDFTHEGRLLDHIVMGVNLIGSYDTEMQSPIIKLLLHVVASHHGQKEWGSPVQPVCIEAHIVHLADMLDAISTSIVEAADKVDNAKWTPKMYGLGNMEQLTPIAVKKILDEGF